MSLPDTGYVPTRLAQWLEYLKQDLVAAYGKPIELDPKKSVLGRIHNVIAARLDELAEATGDLDKCFNEAEAQGIYLENLARLNGVYRREATYSTLQVDLGGTAGTVIPQYSQVRNTVTGRIWETVSKVTLPGQVYVRPYGVKGPISENTADITEIVQPLNGWDTVSGVANSLTVGTSQETHAELRARRRVSLHTGSAGAATIRAKLTNLGLQAKVVENKEADPVVIDDMEIGPYGTLPVVYPDPATTVGLPEKVATVLWRHLGSGSPIYGDESASVVDAAGDTQTVKWTVAPEKVIHVDVPISPAGVATQQQVTQIVLSYFATLQVGENPLQAPLVCALINGISGLKDTVPTFSGGPVGSLTKAIVGTVTLS